MKLAARTITALGRIVTGDEMISRYRSGPDLVRLFNDYGSDDVYGRGFPSRWQYAEEKLRKLNGTEALAALICEVLDPREFLGCDKEPEPAVAYLNKRLSYDGYEVVLESGLAKIRNLKGVQVKAIHPFEGSKEHAHLFIDEQIKKSEKKIQEEDYDGAITNARSLLEAVLKEVEEKLDGDAPRYDGDLPKLYKRVQKLLNLDSNRPDIDQPLKQVLSGLVNIIQGLSGLSNKMGDRHARSYRPSRHHALLICNAAKTVSNFIFDTYSYQQAKK
jgi:hypothetical protein